VKPRKKRFHHGTHGRHGKKRKKRKEEGKRVKSEEDAVLLWQKNSLMSVEDKRVLVDPNHPDLSIRCQCDLLGLCRASFSYEPAAETKENLRSMDLIDRQDTDCPFSGSRRMTAWLRQRGELVNRKRVQRLIRDAAWTTCSSRGCGGRSSTRTST
jgi:putative transposase